MSGEVPSSAQALPEVLDSTGVQGDVSLMSHLDRVGPQRILHLKVPMMFEWVKRLQPSTSKKMKSQPTGRGRIKRCAAGAASTCKNAARWPWFEFEEHRPVINPPAMRNELDKG